ncbi:hypothetical protein ACVWZ5_003276 [Pseudomonas sp. TE6283]
MVPSLQTAEGRLPPFSKVRIIRRHDTYPKFPHP